MDFLESRCNLVDGTLFGASRCGSSLFARKLTISRWSVWFVHDNNAVE